MESRGSESGQTLPEYAIVVAGLAVACLFVLLLLGFGIKGRFESDTPGTPATPAPLTPPASPPASNPTTLADCENGGWRNYPQFRDEAECRDYVEGLGP